MSEPARDCSLPAGIVEQAAAAADHASGAYADHVGWALDDEGREYDVRKADEAERLARALYAAARGEPVSWRALMDGEPMDEVLREQRP